MLYRKILGFLIIVLALVNCRPDSSPSGFDDNFDHAAQYLKDIDSINNFLSSYYYDAATERVAKITGTETSLQNDARLQSVEVTNDDVEYTLYYLKLREGMPSNPNQGFPSIVDSVFTLYTGLRIADNDNLIEFERRITPTWLFLNNTIPGWTHTLPNFKGGRNVTTNGPIEFADGGKGIIFIPSGLAYRNRGTAIPGSGSIPANSNLIFYFDLYDFVENTDHDNDGIPSMMEDVDGDGDPRNDDSDGDFIFDYLDTDDDNDGTPTRDEDANTDGDNNPATNPTDTDGDGIPDYLDPDNS